MASIFSNLVSGVREYLGFHMPEEAQQFHEDRNHNQEDLLPETMPERLPYEDHVTGIRWTADNDVAEAIFHDGNDCIRGELPSEMVQQLQNSPEYLHEVNTQLQAHGIDWVAANELVPGAHACYEPETGERINSGPAVGTWDYQSPQHPEDAVLHVPMDVLSDNQSDDYHSYPPSDEHETHWNQPADNFADDHDHHDHWEEGDYAHDGIDDSY